jgi:hypothetical protein
MNEYIFPFDTCEKPNKNGIAQPYSTFVNLINCLIIFYFLLKVKHYYTFILLFSILCFELIHLFSHMVHVEGLIQRNIVHSLTYVINLSFLFLFYCYTKKIPSIGFIFYLLLLVCFDIYSLLYLPFIFYVTAQSIIFISILGYYFSLLPKFIQNCIYQIFFFVFIIIFLILNEMYNCKKMQELYPDFPYHILIEIVGIVVFYIICSNFYKL